MNGIVCSSMVGKSLENSGMVKGKKKKKVKKVRKNVLEDLNDIDCMKTPYYDPKSIHIHIWKNCRENEYIIPQKANEKYIKNGERHVGMYCSVCNEVKGNVGCVMSETREVKTDLNSFMLSNIGGYRSRYEFIDVAVFRRLEVLLCGGNKWVELYRKVKFSYRKKIDVAERRVWFRWRMFSDRIRVRKLCSDLFVDGMECDFVYGGSYRTGTIIDIEYVERYVCFLKYKDPLYITIEYENGTCVVPSMRVFPRYNIFQKINEVRKMKCDMKKNCNMKMMNDNMNAILSSMKGMTLSESDGICDAMRSCSLMELDGFMLDRPSVYDEFYRLSVNVVCDLDSSRPLYMERYLSSIMSFRVSNLCSVRRKGKDVVYVSRHEVNGDCWKNFINWVNVVFTLKKVNYVLRVFENVDGVCECGVCDRCVNVELYRTIVRDGVKRNLTYSDFVKKKLDDEYMMNRLMILSRCVRMGVVKRYEYRGLGMKRTWNWNEEIRDYCKRSKILIHPPEFGKYWKVV